MTIAIEAPAGVSAQNKSSSFRKSHCDRDFKYRVRLLMRFRFRLLFLRRMREVCCWLHDSDQIRSSLLSFSSLLFPFLYLVEDNVRRSQEAISISFFPPGDKIGALRRSIPRSWHELRIESWTSIPLKSFPVSYRTLSSYSLSILHNGLGTIPGS